MRLGSQPLVYLATVASYGDASLGFQEAAQTELFRGSKSRNKVSIGEPAEQSLTNPLTALQL